MPKVFRKRNYSMHPSEREMSPLEALEFTVCYFIFYNGYSARRYDMSNLTESQWGRLKPGAFVQRMSGRTRKALKKLKSHHFDKMRLDKWKFEDDSYIDRKKLSDLLMEFDKKILK